MKILLRPQIRDRKDDRISYKFDGDIIEATYAGKTTSLDFTGLPDGKLQLYNEVGEPLLEGKIDPQPLRSAEKKDGELYVELINFIGFDAPESAKFPEWIDAAEYEPPTDAKDEQGTDEGASL